VPGPVGGVSFVGRQRELERLLALLERAEHGRGGIFLVGGAPGIGKTSTVRAFAAAARARGNAVLWGACYEGGSAPPYIPWVEALSGFARAIEPEWLQGELGPGAPLLAQLVPDLAAAVAESSPPSALAGAFEHYLLFDAVSRLLVAVAEQQPVVIAFDDLHWADGDSLALLRHVSRLTHRARILLVLAYRHEQIDAGTSLRNELAGLRREADCESLTLAGLDTEAVAEVLAAVAGRAAPEPVARAVKDETGGNPFFVQEMARHLAATDALGHVPAAGAGPAATVALGVPEGIRQMLSRRLARLSAQTLETLHHASAFAGAAPFAVLAALSDVDEDALLDSIDEALAAGMLMAVPARRESYAFTHAIVRHAVYDDISPGRRVRLHRRIGEAIERVCTADLDHHLAELAHHYLLAAPGGDATKAVEYARRAAERARALHAYDEAARLFDLSLRALEMEASADSYEQCELLLALGEARNRTGQPEEAKPHFAHAGAIARGLRTHNGDVRAPLLLARAALGYGGNTEEKFENDPAWLRLLDDALEAVGPDDSAVRSRLLARAARVTYWLRSAEQSDVMSVEALAMARRVGDPAALAAALSARQYVVTSSPNVAERHALCDELFELGKASGDTDITMTAARWRLAALLETGDIAALDVELEAFARRAEELQQPYYRWCTGVFRAMRALLEGRFAEAEQLSAAAREIGRPVDPPESSAIAFVHLGIIRLEQDRIGEMVEPYTYLAGQYPRILATRAMLALALSESGRKDDAWIPYEPLRRNGFGELQGGPYHLMDLAALTGACVSLGDGQGALTLYRRLLPFDGLVIITGLAQAMRGAVAHHLGLLAATARGRGQALPDEAPTWETAHRHFDGARVLYEQMGARPWTARACADQAAAVLAQLRLEGRTTRADTRERLAHTTSLLEHASATATDLEMTWLLRRIEQLRDDAVALAAAPLRVSSRASASLPDGLTRREAEVLRLIATGLTNREIAGRLALSAATVERHIANTYAKIDAGSRADAVAYTIRHGLVEA
jgi:DNA-binding CsgD family transcriptional regulator